MIVTQIYSIGLCDDSDAGEIFAILLSNDSDTDSIFPIGLFDPFNAGQMFSEYSYISQKGALCLYKLCYTDISLGRGVLPCANSRVVIF